MKIEIGELKRIASKNQYIASELDSTLKTLNTELNNITNNIRSAGLHEANLDLKLNLIKQVEDIRKNLYYIHRFFITQLDNYHVTMEEALSKIENLINSIEGCIDENGNVTSSYKYFNNFDEAAYNKGLEDFNEIYGRLYEPGNEDGEQQWNNLDYTINYLRDKGMSDEMIAGICANIVMESGFRLHEEDDGSGVGICQWENRDTTINGDIVPNQPTDLSLKGQLDHIYYQVQGKIARRTDSSKTVYQLLEENNDDVNKCAEIFCTDFERPSEEKTPLSVTVAYRQKISNIVYAYIKNDMQRPE